MTARHTRAAPSAGRTPDFNQFLKVLRREYGRWLSDAFAAGGYDYVTFGSATVFPGCGFRPVGHTEIRSHSLTSRSMTVSLVMVSMA